MFFLNKLILFINKQVQSLELPSGTVTEELEITSEVIENQEPEVENEFLYEGSTFSNKIFRTQKLYSGPETSYEEETWTPEYQPISLFHKQ